ncbi:MAG: hypothetical protein ACXWQO_12980 [Bdellovibrionota bacterium]
MGFHQSEFEPKSSDRTFGMVMAGFFALLAFVPWLRRGENPRWALAAIALLFTLAALFIPAKLRRLHLLWLDLGLLLQKFVSPIFLGLLYFLFFTPLGLLLQIFRADPLRRRLEPEASTYWIDRIDSSEPGIGMKRQF